MTVKQIINALEKIENKDREVVVSDINVNLLVGAYYDILDIGDVEIDGVKNPNVVIITDSLDKFTLRIKKGATLCLKRK